MASIFENPGQWLRDTGKAIERDWRNAGRGEIGRYVGGVGQSAWNVVTAVPRSIQTGDWDKNFFQRGVFSAANLASFGSLDYLGNSSAFQRGIGSDPIIGKNIAAFARVTRTGGRDANVSNEDRNLSVQGAVKVAAAATAYYGGSALYSYLSTPSAAEVGATGAGDIFAGGTGPGLLTPPAYGSSGTTIPLVASTKAALPSVYGGAAAASEGGFFSSLWAGTKEIGKTVLTAGLTQRLIGGSRGGGGTTLGPEIGFAPGGVNIMLPGQEGYYGGPVDGYIGQDGQAQGGGMGTLLLVGAVVVGGLVIWKAVKK